MNPKKILIIEDNALNMKLVTAILKPDNHLVYGTDNAESGIELAREHRPDLILMDIQLPNMDGLEATKIIKSDPDLKHIPVIALTSYAMKKDREKATAVGFAAYITKPIEVENFSEKIKAFIS